MTTGALLTIALGVACIAALYYGWYSIQLRDFRNDATVGMYCRFKIGGRTWVQGRIVGSGVYTVLVYGEDGSIRTVNRGEIFPA